MKKTNFMAFVLISVFAVGVILADNYFDFGLAKKGRDFLSPIGIVVTSPASRISDFFSNLKNISGLQKENRELKLELDKTLAEIARLSEAQKENASLKNDLNFKKESEFNLIPAKVLFFDPTNIRETITVDVGLADGLRTGNVVISEGFLIGRLTDVTKKTAKIVLISDPTSAVPVNVVNSGVSGIMKGKIGGGIVLDQVPQSDKITIGDLLATSGLGGRYPKGLLAGKIENVQQISGSIFQAVEVRPMIDLNKLERVMVIKN